MGTRKWKFPSSWCQRIEQYLDIKYLVFLTMCLCSRGAQRLQDSSSRSFRGWHASKYTFATSGWFHVCGRNICFPINYPRDTYITIPCEDISLTVTSQCDQQKWLHMFFLINTKFQWITIICGLMFYFYKYHHTTSELPCGVVLLPWFLVVSVIFWHHINYVGFNST